MKTNKDYNREEFYKNLTKNELEIVHHLKNRINAFPTLEERISYAVLYFFQYSRVCYIWPESISGGPKYGVQFGFCNGYLLNDKYKLLESNGRKQVYTITYSNCSQIDKGMLDYYIQNALEVDSLLYNKKNKSYPQPDNLFLSNKLF